MCLGGILDNIARDRCLAQHHSCFLDACRRMHFRHKLADGWEVLGFLGHKRRIDSLRMDAA